jgi:hypothetical protein
MHAVRIGNMTVRTHARVPNVALRLADESLGMCDVLVRTP